MAEFVPVSKGRNRLIFGGGRDLVPLPDMVEMQRESYRSFFQENVAPEDRKDFGLQELLREISPISNFDGSFRLEFLDYAIEEPKMSLHEAQHKDCTWNRPVRARVRLHDDRTQEVREEEVYLGDFPVMTARGTFIINGSERVVVNQLARSAGVYFKSYRLTLSRASFYNMLWTMAVSCSVLLAMETGQIVIAAVITVVSVAFAGRQVIALWRR